jgi:hypothetical protein
MTFYSFALHFGGTKPLKDLDNRLMRPTKGAVLSL